MRSGYIAIIGKPNVGKSTILNRLLQVQLSIVSNKPQTTRNRILGILTENEDQCYFLDTPGMIKPHYPLQELMTRQITRALDDADIILWIVDPWFKQNEVPANFADKFSKKTCLCVINKIDLVAKEQLLPIIKVLEQYKCETIVPVSALTNDGMALLKKKIFSYLPEGPHLYPDEDLSDSPERFFIAEIIRKKIFEHFKKEIPYATCVAIDDYKERQQSKDFIRAIIYVEKKSQKGILIGKKGIALKRIGEEARKEIEEFLERSVYLELSVKVKEKWRKDKKFLRELGY